ncbi:hypothetical protein ACYBXJ_29055 [Klebsiella pneumoniae]
MNNSAMPSRLTVVFSASGDKNTIPVNSTPETLADGLAAMDSGFPPLTRIALSAGGKPPKGQDFNGIFNDAYTRFNGSKQEVSIHSTLHFRQLSVDTQKARFLSIQPGMDSGKALSKITRQILMLAVLDGLIIHQDDS